VEEKKRKMPFASKRFKTPRFCTVRSNECWPEGLKATFNAYPTLHGRIKWRVVHDEEYKETPGSGR
jgi:hypothetical protein